MNTPRKRLLFLVATFIASILLSVYYTFRINPENRFFCRATEASDQWNAQLEQHYASKYVIAGGSSSRTSIDPRILRDQYGIALVNAGYTIAFSASVPIELALDYLKPGDTLIVALEPPVLFSQEADHTADVLPKSTSNGDRFLFVRKGFPYSGNFKSLGLREMPVIFLANSNTNWRLAKNMLLSRSLYSLNDQTTVLHPSGWVEVTYKPSGGLSDPKLAPPIPVRRMSSHMHNFFDHLKTWSEQNNVAVMYVIPRHYASPGSRLEMAYLALDVSSHIPVLKDRTLGVSDHHDDFADTPLHLNASGTEKMTHELARLLTKREFWTKKELQHEIERLERQ